MAGKVRLEAAIEQVKLLAGQGAYEAAQDLCRKLSVSAPSDARVWMLLGAIHGQQNDAGRSEEYLRKALSINPGLYAARCNLARILASQHKLQEAEQHYAAALKIRTDDAAIYYELGNTLEALTQRSQAIAAYRQAIQLQPGYRDALFSLGNLLFKNQDLHAALGCIRSAFECDSSFVQAKAVEALILEKQGDVEGAWVCLRPWLNREVLEPVLADAFARVSRHIGRESEAIDCLLKTIDLYRNEGDKVCGLYFRLGDLQERLRRYDDAFESFAKGNALWVMPDNADAFISSLREARRIYSKKVLDAGFEGYAAGKELVFILGMPRSGTSLVEQVIGAHSEVLAGGECPWLVGLSEQVLSGLRDEAGNTPDFSKLTLEAAKAYSSRYLSTMRVNVGAARILTDKTPHNFEYIGLISKLFPDARVIHCTRDPLDTCTSCYCNNFVSGANLAYTRDLQSLGAVYAEYDGLMRYWKENAAIKMFEVEYESMVHNTEQTVREILEFCGLEWEEQCLHFYKESRLVHTASYNQVRQPVYSHAVGRWKRYEKQLEPLRVLLGSGAAPE